MPSVLDSRCILVIGATSGIGRSLAKSIYLLPTKSTVIVAGRRQDRLDELVTWSKQQGGDSTLETLQLDVSVDAQTLVDIIDKCLQKYPEVRGTIFMASFADV